MKEIKKFSHKKFDITVYQSKKKFFAELSRDGGYVDGTTEHECAEDATIHAKELAKGWAPFWN